MINIQLPLWLAIVIGIVYALDKLVTLLKKVPTKVWNKIKVFFCYKNNEALFRSNMISKLANDRAEANLIMQKEQKKQMQKRYKNLAKSNEKQQEENKPN